MATVLEDENMIPDILTQVEILKQTSIEVGIFGDEDSEILQYARANEYGITITPNQAGALTVPLNNEAAMKKAGDFNDLVFIERDGEPPLLARTNGDDIEPMYILLKEVTIPERSFIRSYFDENRDDLQQLADEKFSQILKGELSAKGMLDVIGLTAERGIVKQIESVDSPANAEITVNSKSTSAGTGDSPLENTGQMKRSITYKVRT